MTQQKLPGPIFYSGLLRRAEGSTATTEGAIYIGIRPAIASYFSVLRRTLKGPLPHAEDPDFHARTDTAEALRNNISRLGINDRIDPVRQQHAAVGLSGNPACERLVFPFLALRGPTSHTTAYINSF